MKNQKARMRDFSLSVSIAALFATLTPAIAFAQDSQAVQPANEVADEADEGEAIIVTGSRIARPELNVANPVVAVSGESIEKSGPGQRHRRADP